MGNKTRKTRTQEIINEYLKKGKPIDIRNQIVEMNYRLICWVAKHYQVDGYVEHEDLVNEGVEHVIAYLENLLTKQNARYISKRIFVTCCYWMDIYRSKMMCAFSEEHNTFKNATLIFRDYMRQNRDEWSGDESLKMLVRNFSREENGKQIEPFLSYFSERVDPDEVESEDVPLFETMPLQEAANMIYCAAGLTLVETMAVNTYVFSPYDYYGERRSSGSLVFGELAYQRGVSLSAINSNFNSGLKKLRRDLPTLLKETSNAWYTDIYEAVSHTAVRWAWANNQHHDITYYQTEYDNEEDKWFTTDC